MKRASSFSAVVCVLLLAACGHEYRTSQAVNQWVDDMPDSVSFYPLDFYPSTIRMIAGLPGEEFGASFDGVERARVLLSAGDAGQGLEDQFGTLQPALVGEGFEPLMELKSKGNKVEVYVEDRGVPHYMVLYAGPAATFVLEMIGQVSMDALRRLASLDAGQVMEFFDIAPPAVQEDSSATGSHRDTMSFELEIN